MRLGLVFLFLMSFLSHSLSQGVIETDKIIADSLIGNGSKITGINLDPQNLSVSKIGDTLFISEGNWVLIPGISASNSATSFANAGPDIQNACSTSIYIEADPLSEGSTGNWTILAGEGGVLSNPNSPSTLFEGLDSEEYILQWNVQNQNGSGSFDQKTISIANQTTTSVANSGKDSLGITSQTITLYGNQPEINSLGRWTIMDGIGGVLEDETKNNSLYTGISGEVYKLRWQHYNDCSTSSDELILTFSESAAGTVSSSGKYFIPDQRFRQYLQIAYPDVMDGDSLIVSESGFVNELLLSNFDVKSLDGLQYFSQLKRLQLDNNGQLKSIPYFSNVLKEFSCRLCFSISVLPNFPPSLDTLILSHAKLTYIPTLPDTMDYVSLRQIGEFCCPNEVIHNFKIPEKVKTYIVNDIKLDSFPILPQDKTYLNELSLKECQLQDMPSLNNFVNLQSLSLYSNQLLKIDSLPLSLYSLSIDSNPIVCMENKPINVENQVTNYSLCP